MGSENPSFASHGGPLAGVGVMFVGFVVGDANGFTDLVSPSVEHVMGIFHKAEYMDVGPKELNEPTIEGDCVEVGRRFAA